MKTVIVGGVAGGMSTAARLRRRDESAEIVMLERDHYVSYANCGLPYHIGGEIADRKQSLIVTPGHLRTTLAIDVRTGQPNRKVYLHPSSHAGYYPGALPMHLKLLFAPGNGKLPGAQIVGFDSVDKRIDVLATVLRAGMTVYDLERLELAYSPPYGSPKTRSIWPALLQPTCCAVMQRSGMPRITRRAEFRVLSPLSAWDRAPDRTLRCSC